MYDIAGIFLRNPLFAMVGSEWEEMRTPDLVIIEQNKTQQKTKK